MSCPENINSGAQIDETCCESTGFFEITSNELKFCRLEVDVARFQDVLSSGKNDVIKLLQASPIIRDTRILKGSKYDPLTHYENTPVIGLLGLKFNEETEEYYETYELGYGEAYKNNLFTQDAGKAMANGFFVDYNGRKGFITAAHVGVPFYQGLAYDGPNYELDSNTDTVFFDLDNGLTQHMSAELLDSLNTKTSPISIGRNETAIEGKIVSTISWDEGGNFSDIFPNLKLKSGVAILVTQEIEDEMMRIWQEEGRDYKLEERGKYVGKYIYRVTGKEASEGGGTSGSPVFVEGEFVGINIAGTHIGGISFGIFSPLSMIQTKVLSKLDE